MSTGVQFFPREIRKAVLSFYHHGNILTTTCNVVCITQALLYFPYWPNLYKQLLLSTSSLLSICLGSQTVGHCHKSTSLVNPLGSLFGVPLYSFLTILLFWILKKWSSHLSLSILVKKARVRPSSTVYNSRFSFCHIQFLCIGLLVF